MRWAQALSRDDDQGAETMLVQTDVEMHPVSPHVDVVNLGQTPPGEPLRLVLPLGGQPGHDRRRHSRRRPEELFQGRGEVLRAHPMQVHQREHLGHLRRLPGPRRNDRGPKPTPLPANLIDPTVVHPRRDHLNRPRPGLNAPRFGVPVAHHQPPSHLVDLVNQTDTILLSTSAFLPRRDGNPDSHVWLVRKVRRALAAVQHPQVLVITLVETLGSSGVTLLVDVRLNALSRKPGWSRSPYRRPSALAASTTATSRRLETRPRTATNSAGATATTATTAGVACGRSSTTAQDRRSSSSSRTPTIDGSPSCALSAGYTFAIAR
jgi:hypothetical protein